jgi:hypothetical protein
MFNKLKNVLGLDKAAQEAQLKLAAEIQASVVAKLMAAEEKKAADKAKREANKAKREAKKLAKEAKFELPPVEVEPFIKVIKVDFEGGDPRKGSFELEWNKEFIQWLRTAGYPGEKDENVVDLWFEEMCRNVANQTWEQYEAQEAPHRRSLGNGYTEVS